VLPKARLRKCDSRVLQKDIIVIVGNLRNKFCATDSTGLPRRCAAQRVMQWDNTVENLALNSSAH